MKKYSEGSVSHLPLCGPHAVSVLTGSSLDEIMHDFKVAFGRSERWEGRSSVDECLEIIKSKGFKVCEVKGSGSLKSFAENYTVKGHTYFVRVGNHFLALLDGIAVDQISWDSTNDHWAKRKRVSHAYEVK